MNPARPTSTEVARWIAGHLAAHPRAADTAEGIRRWWLAPGHGEVALDLVVQALTELEREGVVSSRNMVDEVVWGLAAGPAQGGGADPQA